MKIVKQVVGSGENVVIIHGGLANADDMSPIVEALSDKYRVTNINLPGSGRSDWNDAIKTVHDVADTILPELPENAIYIGWSKGGLTTQSIASRYPNRIKQFIGIGTTPKFIATSGWVGVAEPGFVEIVKNVLKDPNSSLDTFVRGMYESEFASLNPKPNTYTQVLNMCDNRPDISREIIQKLVNIVDNTDLRQEFKTISCPIDLIIGTEDPNLPIDGFAQIKALNPRVTIHEINGAQHAPFWTHQNEFNQILYKILGV